MSRSRASFSRREPTTTTTFSFALKVRVSFAENSLLSHWEALKMLYPWYPLYRRFGGRPVKFPAPPPLLPPGPMTTRRVIRDVVTNVPSEALNRTIVPSHVRFAGTMHSRCSVQIPSPFTKSPFVPLSDIDWGTAQASGLP